jgi:hypothetical protein
VAGPWADAPHLCEATACLHGAQDKHQHAGFKCSCWPISAVRQSWAKQQLQHKSCSKHALNAASATASTAAVSCNEMLSANCKSFHRQDLKQPPPP